MISRMDLEKMSLQRKQHFVITLVHDAEKKSKQFFFVLLVLI